MIHHNLHNIHRNLYQSLEIMGLKRQKYEIKTTGVHKTYKEKTTWLIYCYLVPSLFISYELSSSLETNGFKNWCLIVEITLSRLPARPVVCFYDCSLWLIDATVDLFLLVFPRISLVYGDTFAFFQQYWCNVNSNMQFLL